MADSLPALKFTFDRVSHDASRQWHSHNQVVSGMVYHFHPVPAALLQDRDLHA
jgi:hypothetical protein